jgi:Root hair defective 3 GTP-binding protein (RHD3)
MFERLIKGIWLSKAVDSDILIMDVEGTDSRERGDEQVPHVPEKPTDNRTLNVARHYSHSLFQKSLSLIYGNIKLASTKVQTWVS